uniref:BSD domain-containing protein n=1 Tax=Salix viminalis TaxID=40686 RepID=A0A6N2KNY4_SALVM
MSWLFKPLQSNDPDTPPHSPPSSVEDDLSVFGFSIGRRLRSVANFLAPPPLSRPEAAKSQPSDSSRSSQALIGMRKDLAEIGDSLKSGLAKFTFIFLRFNDDDHNNCNQEGGYEDDVAGINEEVIGFVKEISLRPECWVDFPLPLQNDFTMTGAQREHASNIERFVPSLARLRNNLRSETGDGRFWMVYFILLIPRLNERDFEILSTPQIVETRNVLLEKLENKKNVKLENSNNSISETRENTTSREEVAWIVNAIESLRMNGEENSKQFLKDQIDISTSMDNRKRLEGEEVSFSDLEDDYSDFSTRLSASRKSQSIRAPSPSGSSDWVQLNESSDIPGGLLKARQSFSRDNDSDAESTDWHKVDEFE